MIGIALIPARDFTTASNFTFVFMALTILVAELGGRTAAVATALCSALSLDFFLTQPYMRLSIADKHDVIAFVGLTVCGLIAAAVGSQRGERVAALRASRAQLGLVHSGLEQLEKGVPVDLGLKRVLDASRGVLPIAAAVVRDTRGNLLAATERAHGMPVPTRSLEPDALAGRRGDGPAPPATAPGRGTTRPRGRGPPGRLARRLGHPEAGERTGATDPLRCGPAAGGDPRPGGHGRGGRGTPAVTPGFPEAPSSE